MRNGIQGLGWYVRRTEDTEPLGAFYRDVIGLPALYQAPGVHVFWSGEAQYFEILRGGTRAPVVRDHTAFPCIPIFRSPDLDSAVDRLTRAGVEITETIQHAHGRTVYFLDSDGQISGISERHRTSPRPEDTEAWRRWDAGETRLADTDPLPPDLQHLGWVTLHVADVASEVAFYRDIVGLDVAHDHGGHGALLNMGDGTMLGLYPGGSAEPIPTDRDSISNAWMLRVRDMPGIVADLKTKGVHFVNEPFESTGGTLAYFVDPEGHLASIQDHPPQEGAAVEMEAWRRWQARTTSSSL